MLPSKLDIKGSIKKAFEWNVKDTTHYFVYTETGIKETYPVPKDSISGHLNGFAVDDLENDMKDAAYYFYHYISYYSDMQLQWKIYDFVKECPFDIHFHFIHDAFRITDLDNNGQQEIWVMYSLACVSDASPDNLKLIMYEGNTKYAIRGLTRNYEDDQKSKMDSPHAISSNFTNPKFKDYGLELWKSYNVIPYSFISLH